MHWHRDPRFSHLAVYGGSAAAAAEAEAEDDDDGDGRSSSSTSGSGTSFRERVARTGSRAEAADVLTEEFARRLESLLRLPGHSISSHSEVSELGVDSLVAVEIRSWFWKAVGKDVTVMKILTSTSIAKCEFAPPL